DRDAARPSGRRTAAALQVARHQFDARQQAADPPHVGTAGAADLVADAVQSERVVPKRFERLKARLEGERLALFVGPERPGDDAVGTENDDQPLLSPGRVFEAQA